MVSFDDFPQYTRKTIVRAAEIIDVDDEGRWVLDFGSDATYTIDPPAGVSGDPVGAYFIYYSPTHTGWVSAETFKEEFMPCPT